MSGNYPKDPAVNIYPEMVSNDYQSSNMPPPYQDVTYTNQVQPMIQPTIIVRTEFGSRPQGMQCINCGASIVTQVSYRTGLITWAICGGICLLGGGFGCCLIPFCIDSCKDAEHQCPNCKTLLGVDRKLK